MCGLCSPSHFPSERQPCSSGEACGLVTLSSLAPWKHYNQFLKHKNKKMYPFYQAKTSSAEQKELPWGYKLTTQRPDLQVLGEDTCSHHKTLPGADRTEHPWPYKGRLSMSVETQLYSSLEAACSQQAFVPICWNVSQIIAENSANSGEVFGLVPGTIETYIHTYHM